MILGTTPTWEQSGPVAWLLTTVIAPMAIGLALGLFARVSVRRVLTLAVVAGVMLGALGVVGMVNVEPARAILSAVGRFFTTAIDVIGRTLSSSPVSGAAALTGLSLGVLLAWWRQSRKGIEC